MSHTYKDSFFNYIDLSSSRSANIFLKKVTIPLIINSILDVGCGRGAWLAEWAKYDKQIFGVDGAYVNTENLLISQDCFKHQDISKEFFLGRQYDVVQCLEVAEHLQEQNADILIHNLISHGKIILFSAAVPGQGGEYHVNEQPLNYWVEKFESLDFKCFDYIRPQIILESQIEPWYRFNTLLFVHKDMVGSLPIEILIAEVDALYNFNNIVDRKWLIRNKILNSLPYFFINFIAKWKHYLIVMNKK